MAMRPNVKRNGWLLIAFAALQCIISQLIVHKELIELSYSGRVTVYTISTILCATLLFVALIYMVIKGNPEHS
jgi:hypothetical protein